MSSDPVLVLYKSDQCGHCRTLFARWENIKNVVRNINPKIRFFTLSAVDNSGKFDVNSAPKDLIRYNKWFPMILLVPGKLWDTAFQNLGPGNNVELVDGVQVFNSEKGQIKYKKIYNMADNNEIGRWVKDSLSDPEFIRVSTAGPISIPNILSSVLKPVSSSSSSSPNPLTKPDICSFKIINKQK